MVAASAPGHATQAYNSPLPKEVAYLARDFETQCQPTLARAREKCDGRSANPSGRGPFRSANHPPGTPPG